MKNIKHLPTQTMFKCIYVMFDEFDGKAIVLDTSAQEN